MHRHREGDYKSLKKQSKKDTDLEEIGRFFPWFIPPLQGLSREQQTQVAPDARAEINPVLGLYGTPPDPPSTEPQR